MTLSVLLALAGYSLVYVGMAFMSGRLLPVIPMGWRVITAQATVFLCANYLFGQLFTRERPTVAGTLTLCANVICMVVATCLMEWRTPTAPMLVGTMMAMMGGLVVVMWK